MAHFKTIIECSTKVVKNLELSQHISVVKYLST